MARILAIGAAALDILTTVERFPDEDSDTRAQRQRLFPGGNVVNSLRVLVQLGHQVHFSGVFGNDPFGRYLLASVAEAGVGCDRAVVAAGRAPVSQILLSRVGGSRTIVHFRDPQLPELRAEQLTGGPGLADVDWLHVEARPNVDEIEAMLIWARQQRPQMPVSLEVEKPRPGVERLYEYASAIVFSKEFAVSQGHDSAVSLLRWVETATAGRLRCCAWGDEGAYALDGQGNLHHSPAVVPPRVVDTCGAGDTFNAGLIDACLQRLPAPAVLARACALAGKKCGQEGLDGLVC